MKKRLIILITMLLILCCSSCAAEDKSLILKNDMSFEKMQNDIFYYNVVNNEKILYKSNIENGDTQTICTQSTDNRPSLSIINNKLYYIDGKALYSIDLAGSKLITQKTGEIKNDNISFLAGNFDGHFNIFYHEGYIYIQGQSLYRVENGEINVFRNDVTSINIYNDNIYYGTSSGDIYILDSNNNNDTKIVSKDEISNIQDNYIKMLGGNYFINSLQICNDKLWFVLSGGQTLSGQIYYYDLKSKQIGAINKISGTSINYFSVYNDILYCYGETNSHRNALFTISDNDVKILSQNIAGFNIFGGKIYCYDYDINMFMEMNLSGEKQKQLNISYDKI